MIQMRKTLVMAITILAAIAKSALLLFGTVVPDDKQFVVEVNEDEFVQDLMREVRRTLQLADDKYVHIRYQDRLLPAEMQLADTGISSESRIEAQIFDTVQLQFNTWQSTSQDGLEDADTLLIAVGLELREQAFQYIGITVDDVDGIYLGTLTNGFSYRTSEQGTLPISVRIQQDDYLRRAMQSGTKSAEDLIARYSYDGWTNAIKNEHHEVRSLEPAGFVVMSSLTERMFVILSKEDKRYFYNIPHEYGFEVEWLSTQKPRRLLN